MIQELSIKLFSLIIIPSYLSDPCVIFLKANIYDFNNMSNNSTLIY